VSHSSPHRALVNTPDGQIHIRTAGSGDAVVLMHWTPSSSRQYAGVIPRLAELGYRAIALDHLGFGFSDPRPRPFTIADFADTLAQLLDALDIARSHVLGGHVSSEIAAEFALRHPAKTRRLVLDGSPVWTRERREAVLSSARPNPPPWSEAGDHIAWAWQRTVWLQKMWDANFCLDSDTAAEQMRLALIDSLLSGTQSDTAEALKLYDMDHALRRLQHPVLALTATTDPLYSCHTDVMSLVKDVREHIFQGTHPLHSPYGVDDYVRVIDRFLRDAPLGV
jgi:pimeloyl-ACP methyl ester carboxylesterase